jgi:serine phosphatase RsbU (regulator of sigma subunit)
MVRISIIFIGIISLSNIVFSQGGIEKILNKADLVYAENPAESFALCETAERRALETGEHSEDGSISLCKGRYYVLIAKHDAANIELSKAISIFEKEKDFTNLATAYKIKSILLERIGEKLKAHLMLLKALDIHKINNDEEGRVGVMLNLVLDHKMFNEPDSMKYYLDQLEGMMEGAQPKRYYFYYQNWGIYYQMVENQDRAIQLFQLALSVAEKEKLTDSKATVLNLLSEAFLAKGELLNADLYAEESYQFSEENNLVFESYEALTQWIQVKEKQKDYLGAYHIQKKWIKVEKEINDLKRIQKVNEIESQLNLAEKEKEIAEGEIALQRSNLEGQKARNRNTQLLGIVLIIVVLLFFTVFIYLRTKKLNKTINEQKEEVEIKSLKLEDALVNIQDSLEYSKLIQNAMLPDREELAESFDQHFVFYRPKDIVSGDFYWFYRAGSKSIIAVGDCTGHGVPGALVSMVCHDALNKVVIDRGVTAPAQILDEVREIVMTTFKKRSLNLNDGMDIALCCIEDKKLTFSGANNPLWIFRSLDSKVPEFNEKCKHTEIANSRLIELKANKQPIGHYHNPFPFTQTVIELLKGDGLYLFSDGYADQFGGDKGKKLKVANFKMILAKCQGLELSDQAIHISSVFDQWKAQIEQLDDVCVIGVRL